MRYTSLFVVLALVSFSTMGAIMVNTPDAGAVDTSEPPVLVSTNLYPKTSPNVVVTDDGRIYVAWSEQRGADHDVFVSYSMNNGTTFSSPKRVNNVTTGNQFNPRIAVNDAGVLFVVWWDQKNDTGDILFSRSLDGGESFEEPVPVHADLTGTQSYPDIAANGNDVAVVWEDPKSNNTISIWNADTGALVRVIDAHIGAVRDVEYSPDGTELASGAEDNLVKIWNPSNGNELENLTGHAGMVTTVNWSTDGNMLATGSWDYNVTLWNTANYNVIKTLNVGEGGVPVRNPVNSLGFSPNGSQIAVAYNGILGGGMPTGEPTEAFNITVWNLTGYSNWTENEGGQGHTKSVTDIAFSHNSTLIASCSKDDTVRVWNATTGARLVNLNLNMDVMSVCWSPDSTQVAAGLSNGSIVVFELANTANQYWLGPHVGRVNSISWNAVRDELASAASEPNAKVWNLGTKVERLNLSGHTNSVYSIDWRTDGDFIATAGGNSGEYQMGENRIYCALSNDDGLTFAAPVTVSDSFARTRLRPKVGMDASSEISIVWYDQRNGADDVYYTNSTDGITFTANIAVSAQVGVVENVPDIAVEDGGKVHLVWQHKLDLAGEDVKVHYANSSDGFANDVELSVDGQVPRVGCSPSGSVVWITWRESGLISNVSYDGGLTFIDREAVNTSNYADSSVSIDSYGQASIVWLDWVKQNVYHASTVLQDNWRPTVLSTVPAHNAVDVSVFSTICVNFSEPMNKVSAEDAFMVNNATHTLGSGDCSDIEWSSYGDRVNFTFDLPLDYNGLYVVTVANTAADISGNTMQSNYVFTFATSDDVDPPVISHVQTIFAVGYNETYTATVTIIDWWGTVTAPAIHYRGVSSASFVTSALTPIGNKNYTGTIPAQGALGNVSYYFTASDNRGNSARLPAAAVDYLSYNVTDLISPEITHIPEAAAAVHRPIGIAAVVADEIDLANVTLNYMEVGASHFISQSMTPNSTFDPDGFSTIIPAQHIIGELEYNITAYDNAGNMASTSMFTVTITDLMRPEINSVLPEYRENETLVLIRANVTDDVAVAEVILYFKAVGGDHWVERNMVKTGADVYEFTIPAQRKSGTIYFYVNATDTSGNLASTLTEQDQFGIEVVGTGPNNTVYYVLAIVLVAMVVVLVYLFATKFAAKSKTPPKTPETAEPGSEMETETEPQTLQTEEEQTIQERVDADEGQ